MRPKNSQHLLKTFPNDVLMSVGGDRISLIAIGKKPYGVLGEMAFLGLPPASVMELSWNELFAQHREILLQDAPDGE